MPQGGNGSDRPFFGTRAGATLIVFIIAAGFLLLFEHRAHIPGDYYLLGLILAFCVGIHLFMHGGHGNHGGHGGGHGAHDDHGIRDKVGDSRSAADDKGVR